MKKLLLLILAFSSNAFAFSEQVLMRSPKALLMGDAFTAVNDDSYTLFYNPASMARHKKSFTLYPLQGYLSGTNVINDMDKFDDVPKEPAGVADLLMNYPVHASMGTAPGFKIFNFGFNVIATDSYDALLRNKAHPMLDVDFKSDRGFIAGFGIPLGDERLKPQGGQQTSIGVSAKYISRQGIRDTLALTGPTMMGTLTGKKLEDILKSLGKNKAKTWGYDVGVEHVVRSRNSQFVFGLSYLDIGNTKFKTSGEVPLSDIRSQLNLGMAFGQKYNLFHYIFATDLKYLDQDMEFSKRFKAGAEIGVGPVSLLAGINSGYYSYGAKLDFGVLSLMAGFYDLEMGSGYKQTKSRRLLLYLSLFDFSFDV